MEKIKDLEKQIQAYIESHAGSEVQIEISKDIEFTADSHILHGMTWKVIVSHPSAELNCRRI